MQPFQIYPLIRGMSALFGLFSIILVYLIGKEAFNKKAGLWAAAIASVSIDYILLSRLMLLDMYLVFFTSLTFYIYVKYKKAGNSDKYLILYFISLPSDYCIS